MPCQGIGSNLGMVETSMSGMLPDLGTRFAAQHTTMLHMVTKCLVGGDHLPVQWVC